MDTLTLAHKTFLTELLQSGVAFMLIGGYAVNYHGYPRYTSDMDIWLKPDEENKKLFAEFLRQKNFNAESVQHILSLDFSIANAFHLGKDETRIDFLTRISGVNFDDAYIVKVLFPLGDKQIPVINFEHLIANKMLSARLKDKADVEELQQVNKYRDNKI